MTDAVAHHSTLATRHAYLRPTLEPMGRRPRQRAGPPRTHQPPAIDRATTRCTADASNQNRAGAPRMHRIRTKRKLCTEAIRRGSKRGQAPRKGWWAAAQLRWPPSQPDSCRPSAQNASGTRALTPPYPLQHGRVACTQAWFGRAFENRLMLFGAVISSFCSTPSIPAARHSANPRYGLQAESAARSSTRPGLTRSVLERLLPPLLMD